MWETIRIAELGSVVTGKTPSSNNLEHFGEDYPFITPTDMDAGRIVHTERGISQEGYIKFSRQILPRRSICFVCIGTVGKICLTTEKSLTNQQINSVVVDTKRHDPFFVYYLLSTYAEAVKRIAGGTATPIVNKTLFENIEVLVPNLSTQRKIGAILSLYDDLIENNLRRMRILEAMAQNLYCEWFVKFRFPGHRSTLFVDSCLGKIPEGWRLNRILEFGDVITGKTPSKANSDFFGDDVPFVKIPDMHGNSFILGTGDRLSLAGAKSQIKKTIPPGAICVSCIGTIGVVSITTENCQTNQQINSVVLTREQFREFLFFRLKEAKKDLENLGANGATMGNVNKGKFESLAVITPSDDLVAEYHDFADPLFSEMRALSQKNGALRRTRDLLLPRLISGELDVSDLDIYIGESA